MKQFFRDLWYSYKEKWGQMGDSYSVKEPDIEFSYTGGFFEGMKSGVFLRSTLWKNKREVLTLDYNIKTSLDTKSHIELIPFQGLPVYGSRRNVLLIFVNFENSYPEKVLHEWTARYMPFMNDYFRKKQHVSKPIQIDMTSVVIPPPRGIKDAQEIDRSPLVQREVINKALQKIGSNDFQAFIIAPVSLGLSGGWYGGTTDREILYIPLGGNVPYTPGDQENILMSLLTFQDMMQVISHELLHSFGLAGDHIPMGIRPDEMPDEPLKRGDHAGLETEYNLCELSAISSNYYFVDPPKELTIEVGKEPPWAEIFESASGRCFRPKSTGMNQFMKDGDNDGIYEMIYSNNIIGLSLQRSLGWVDIDGDNIAEIADRSPYGGIKKRGAGAFGKTPASNIIKTQTFTPLGEVSFDGCRFMQIKLEKGFRGLFPLECKKFNTHVQNIYRGLPYDWIKISEEYGTVLIPRLSIEPIIDREKIPPPSATPAPVPYYP